MKRVIKVPSMLIPTLLFPLLFIAGLVTGAILYDSGVECPPLIERSSNLQLSFGGDVDMTLTELDLEFAEACGLTWQDPVRVVPPAPEGGGL